MARQVSRDDGRGFDATVVSRAAEIAVLALLFLVAAPVIAMVATSGKVTGPAGQDVPVSQSAPAAPAAPAASAPDESRPTPAGGFSEPFSGTASQSQSDRLVHLHISLVAQGEHPASVEVDLVLEPGPGGRNTASSNSFVLSEPSGTPLCTGEVERLTAGDMGATCDGRGTYEGERLSFVATFDQGLAEQVQGTLEVRVVG